MTPAPATSPEEISCLTANAGRQRAGEKHDDLINTANARWAQRLDFEDMGGMARSWPQIWPEWISGSSF